MNERTTEYSCVACKKGKIVEVTGSRFRPESGPLIIGPGSRGQFSKTKSYHCGNCGIVYAFPPGTKKSEAEGGEDDDET